MNTCLCPPQMALILFPPPSAAMRRAPLLPPPSPCLEPLCTPPFFKRLSRVPLTAFFYTPCLSAMGRNNTLAYPVRCSILPRSSVDDGLCAAGQSAAAAFYALLPSSSKNDSLSLSLWFSSLNPRHKTPQHLRGFEPPKRLSLSPLRSFRLPPRDVPGLPPSLLLALPCPPLLSPPPPRPHPRTPP